MTTLAQAGAITNETRTVNQGDITNNFTINSSDANVSARETGSLIQDQITNAHNNAKSAIGAY